MRQEPGPRRGQDGFAAVDALVAVTILSSSLALSLMAAQVGMRASRSAGETRDVELLLRERLEGTLGQSRRLERPRPGPGLAGRGPCSGHHVVWPGGALRAHRLGQGRQRPDLSHRYCRYLPA
jgi:hypothetical protein